MSEEQVRILLSLELDLRLLKSVSIFETVQEKSFIFDIVFI